MRRRTSIITIVAVVTGALAALAPGVVAQTGASDHPLVGTWTVIDASDPGAAPALAIYHADGSAVYVSPDGVLLGAWGPSGEDSADLTLLFPQPDPAMGPVGVAVARASIELAADGGTFTGTYTFEFPAEGGGTTGEIGPGEVTGTRVAVEPMGEPVASFEEAFAAPSAEGTGAPASPMAPEPSPAAVASPDMEASPAAGGSPAPEPSPAA